MDGTTNNNLSKCKHCSHAIARTSWIGCEGFCNEIFHATCVKLSTEELIKYRQSHNFWWMCNSCSALMTNQRNSRHILFQRVDSEEDSPKPKEIIRIDDDIAKLKKQIASIHQTLANTSSAPSHSESKNMDSPIVHRSPVEPSPLSQISPPDTQLGTKAADHLSSTIVEERSTNERFWLFLTRIKNYVNEREIFKLASRSLGTDDIVVKRLVPAWKDPISMPFISFKIGINMHIKGTALLPTTWPTGLQFREFCNNYWEPL